MLKLELPKLVGDGIVPSLYRLFNTSIESESLFGLENNKAYTDLYERRCTRDSKLQANIATQYSEPNLRIRGE